MTNPDRRLRSVPRSDQCPDGAVLEQAKGVLIFRYAVDADAALALIETWAAEAGVDRHTVAMALVHDICQGSGASTPGDRALVRYLIDRLRLPPTSQAPGAAPDPSPVTVTVDLTDISLDAVVAAAREAERRGVGLEIGLHREVLDGDDDGSLIPGRVPLQRRAHLAVQIARTVAPGVPVRLSAQPRTGQADSGARWGAS